MPSARRAYVCLFPYIALPHITKIAIRAGLPLIFLVVVFLVRFCNSSSI